MPTLRRVDDVHVLDLGSDENRFSPDWLTSCETALDAVLDDPAPLITVGEGKFYSNGLDLDWLMAHPEQLASYSGRVQALLARVLTLGVPTVAAISGHAFGAGAMFALAHDRRAMRVDRGYFCLPEVDIHIPFTPGMAALIQAKLTSNTAVAAMTTGRRYNGPDAVSAQIAEATAAQDELVSTAAELLAGTGSKDAAILGAIKQTMYGHVVAALHAA